MQNHSEVQFKLKRFRIMCLTFVIFSSKAEPNQTLSRNPLTPSQSLAFLYLEKSLGGGKVAPQKQFLDHDKQVLRFFTICEDLPYIVHYYLADDTIEIRESHRPNDGRDSFSLLLRRQKLPDTWNVNQPGQKFIGDNYLTCDEIYPGG